MTSSVQLDLVELRSSEAITFIDLGELYHNVIVKAIERDQQNAQAIRCAPSAKPNLAQD